MPTYTFRCRAQRHEFTAVYSMMQVPDELSCNDCGDLARRVIGAPALGIGATSAMRAHDAAAASAENPQVVASPPPRISGATPTTTNPLHRTLPRP